MSWPVLQVAFSTHEAKVTAGGKYGDDSDNSEEGSDEEDGDDEEAEEREEQADTPIPMESVMGTFKVRQPALRGCNHYAFLVLHGLSSALAWSLLAGTSPGLFS